MRSSLFLALALAVHGRDHADAGGQSAHAGAQGGGGVVQQGHGARREWRAGHDTCARGL